MTQTIKPNDLVYVPSMTNTLQKVIRDNNKLAIDDGYYRYAIDEQGYKYDFDLATWGTQPFAFLATPEMKEKLEQVYGKLEDIPVDEELEEFKSTLNELSSFWAEMPDRAKYSSTNQLLSEATVIKDKLVQMFKERGSK